MIKYFIVVENFNTIKKIAYASSIGLVLVISTFIGLGIGYFLDTRFGTTPWITIGGLLFGIIAGFYNGYEMIRKIIRD
ncbi:MAG: AtpZ/AtpI family protein [bacterium]|nr:AtpZ/AtpI family protein [bacterium]